MTNKKIIIAGGTGFMGQEMIKYFGKENDVVILTRQLQHSKTNRNDYSSLNDKDLENTRFVKWDAATVGDWVKELESADLIINLAGKTVNCRYTKKNKKEILESRINATKAIGHAIQQCQHPPKLWINSSSATLYRHAEDQPLDEYSKDIHDDFSAQVCKQWEQACNNFSTPATRKVILRMAITLVDGGVLIPYFNLLKFGLGGKQGNGKQMYCWVHIEDTCRVVEWICDHDELSGAFNCCAPHPVSNKEFMRTLRQVTGHKIGLPAYEWMLRIGAFLIGTEVELVLKSRWVLPTKLLESGYSFKFPTLEEALTDIIKNVPRKQYHLF